MTGVIILNQGEQHLLQNGLTGVIYTLRLYKLDVTAGLTPDEVDQLTEADFAEANFTGYSAATLATAGWTITQGDPTEAVQPEKQFTSSANQASQDIWGYYVTRNSDGMAIWFEPGDGPVPIAALGDRIDVVAAITLDDTRGHQLETGDIIATGRSTVGVGWLLCNGAAVSRTTYADLFAAISTTYGIGDGSTTFNVPDYRQRFVMGKAASGTGAVLGSVGGNIDHVHDLDTATSHAKGSIVSGTTDNIWIQRKTVTNWNATIEGNLAGAGGDTDLLGSGTALGGSSAAANPPFGTANWKIKT